MFDYEFPKLNIANKISVYLKLIKYTQTLLLLYTAIFTYLITSVEHRFFWTEFIWFIGGLFFAISGSTLLNMYIDQDIDAKMSRTKNRPIPAGIISATTIRNHGIIFVIGGVGVIGLFVNIITMFVVLFGAFVDVVIYSMWLKRRTKYSIFFGGVAGGLPATAGRTAIINEIDIIALLVLVFVLLWVPIHILSLSIIPNNYKGYKEADIPMWPVVSGKESTMKLIAWASIIDGVFLIILAYYLHISIVFLWLISLLSMVVIAIAIYNMIQPSFKWTFILFKFASVEMILSFLFLYLGLI